MRASLAAGVVATVWWVLVLGVAPEGRLQTAQEAASAPPQLDALEPAVAEQIRQGRRELDEAANRPGISRGALAEAYGSLARLYHVYEFFEPAEAAYLEAVRLAPNDVRWPHLLGYLYQQTGRLEDAARRLMAARQVQADDHAATVRLGEVYLGLSRLRDAREQFESVLTTFPALARHGLGEVALRENRFRDAIAHFEAALERVPQATSIHYPLAMAYRGLGRLDEARSHLERRGQGGIRIGDPIVEGLQALVRGERGLVVIGNRAFEAGRFQEAADAFGRAVRDAPASVAARANLGLALARLGNASGAVEQFEAVLRLDQGNVIAHASLGIMLGRQGRDAEAAEHLRAAFAQAPDDRTVRTELLGALSRLGLAGEAIEVLSRARSLDPDDEETTVRLSILEADRERYRDAVALLDEATRRHPEWTAASTTLARLLASSPDVSLRDGRRALDLAMAVYAQAPEPAHGETVAMALAELGRCEEAATWVRRAAAEATRAKDAAESARLAGELPRYDTPSCRRGGR